MPGLFYDKFNYIMIKIIFVLLMCVCCSVQAEVYKWIDENGNVHYGDKPDTANKSTELNIDSKASVVRGIDSSREEKREKLLEVMAEDRIEKQEARKKKQQKKAENKRKCNYYRDHLRSLKRASGVYGLDKDGNRVYQSNKKRKQTEAKLQKRINKYCR